MIFGKRFKLLRQEKELTQKQLGARFGVAESTVSLYESDKRTPDKDFIISIAEFFNVSTDYLLGSSDARRSNEIAAASSDVPYEDLPPEALEELEKYKELLRLKYGKKNS